mmetsp:Transcript_38096/g.88653  ORF Transcript_38096/g.88653 Transcript_38096/m.88653 type:complete len:95 (-) Transcript_38096:25-309(-)
MDLYRLSGDVNGEMLEPLDLPYVLTECISLIEWPRLGPHMPESRVEVHFLIDEAEEIRYIDFVPYGLDWEERLGDMLKSGALDPYIVSKNKERS